MNCPQNLVATYIQLLNSGRLRGKGITNINPQYKLLNANTLNRSIIAKESVDLTVTSPPYNLGKKYTGKASDDSVEYDDYLDFTERWLANCFYWTKSTGRLCVNVSLDKNKDGKQPVASDVTHLAKKVGWNYHATIIWNEGNISRRTAWGSWMSASAPHVIAPVETIIVLYKDRWKRDRQGANDISRDEFMEWVLGIWSFSGESARRIGHEAPFPRELPKRCIKLFSFVGDTVLDPFVGSGTTLIETKENDRAGIGVEKELRYCNLTMQRLQNECELKLEASSPESQGRFINQCWTA
jgi:site-specific DNA-methyltransferase (adenine-specific)